MYLLAVIHQSTSRRQWIDTPRISSPSGILLSSLTLKASVRMTLIRFRLHPVDDDRTARPLRLQWKSDLQDIRGRSPSVRSSDSRLPVRSFDMEDAGGPVSRQSRASFKIRSQSYVYIMYATLQFALSPYRRARPSIGSPAASAALPAS